MKDHTLQRTCALFGSAVLLLAGLSAGCKVEGTPGGSVDDRTPYTPPTPADPYMPDPPVAKTRKIVLLHTNDEHSHLLGFAPNAAYPFRPVFVNGEFNGPATAVSIATQLASGGDTKTAGGIVRRQFLVNQERAAATAAGDPVLLLSAGDVMMGTVFHAAYAQGQAPDYLAMAVLGYDFIALGNHEFDFGADVLARAIQSVQQTTFGSTMPILASNIHFDDVATATASGGALQALYGAGDSGAPIMPWATKTLSNGLKVGFLGLVGYDAALVAPFKSPIFFSTPRGGPECSMANPCPAGSCTGGRCVNALDAAAHVQALAAEAQAIVDVLKNEQMVDVVVAITHLGKVEDEALASFTTGIDAIIGGHSHTASEAYEVNGTIITQTGGYGRSLGKLVLTVAPDGTVGFDDATSELLAVGSTLDAQIYGDTDLTMAKLSDELATALNLTGGVIAPVLKGLDAALAPMLGLTSLLDPVVSSNHDVIGEVEFADTHLSHLVTDANRLSYLGGTCHLEAGGPPVVAVQANGVIRESLRFSNTSSTSTGSASFADVFRVLPLGASPFEGPAAAPGYPVVAFTVSAAELLGGLEVGVSMGLQADSFFLSYSGVRTEYDRNRPPLDPTNTSSTTGHIVKIELDFGAPGAPDYRMLYDAHAAGGIMTAFTDPMTGNPMNPTTYMVTIVTNLYLATYLEAFGITPRDWAGNALPGTGMARLSQTVLCHTGMPKNCAVGSVSFVSCPVAGGGPPWPVAPEVKEWQLLHGFLSRALGGMIPPQAYAGDTVPDPLLRVRDVTQ